MEKFRMTYLVIDNLGHENLVEQDFSTVKEALETAMYDPQCADHNATIKNIYAPEEAGQEDGDEIHMSILHGYPSIHRYSAEDLMYALTHGMDTDQRITGAMADWEDRFSSSDWNGEFYVLGGGYALKPVYSPFDDETEQCEVLFWEFDTI